MVNVALLTTYLCLFKPGARRKVVVLSTAILAEELLSFQRHALSLQPLLL